MCGINGIHSVNNIEKSLLVKNMNTKLIHRGPDQEGFYSNLKISLGMRRLSIIDLATGNQPVFSDDKSKCIVFNGEIYNYKKIRKDLENFGVTFNTNSDTEVILKSYIYWGEKCLEYFRGMFAFAIYDNQKDELLLARDAFGEKPLYYSNFEGNFVFSSEIKAILETGLIPKKININAMNIYLQLGYIPAPYSIIDNIYKLEPGHFLVFKSGTLNLTKWYDHYSINKSFSKTESIKTLISNSVIDCLVSDVPLGVFLSGGIDSSIIAFHAKSILKQNLNSFTLGFDNKEFDESKKAKLFADKLKTDHQTEIISENIIIKDLMGIISKMDEPISDSSFIATYQISKFASKKVKVVLTGDGGDEIFAGYEKYLINKICDIYNLIPGFLKKFIDFFLTKIFNPKSNFYRKYKKIKENSKISKKERIINTMVLAFNLNDLNRLLINSTNINTSLDFLNNDFDFLSSKHDLLTCSLLLDQRYTLEGCMLQKVDRASMLNSLETRSPFLNLDLVKYINSLHPNQKINFFSKKHLLKKEYKNLLPKEILFSTKKGFSSPISYWLNKDTINYFSEFFDKNFISSQGLFNFEYLQSTLNSHLENLTDDGNKLWNYIVLQNWLKVNISFGE
jgi:asparagine synthase (glutamine-hydrolysing)